MRKLTSNYILNLRILSSNKLNGPLLIQTIWKNLLKLHLFLRKTVFWTIFMMWSLMPPNRKIFQQRPFSLETPGPKGSVRWSHRSKPFKMLLILRIGCPFSFPVSIKSIQLFWILSWLTWLSQLWNSSKYIRKRHVLRITIKFLTRSPIFLRFFTTWQTWGGTRPSWSSSPTKLPIWSPASSSCTSKISPVTGMPAC